MGEQIAIAQLYSVPNRTQSFTGYIYSAIAVRRRHVTSKKKKKISVKGWKGPRGPLSDLHFDGCHSVTPIFPLYKLLGLIEDFPLARQGVSKKKAATECGIPKHLQIPSSLPIPASATSVSHGISPFHFENLPIYHSWERSCWDHWSLLVVNRAPYLLKTFT